MNEHPGRDTDVISRLSKSTIQDLSFYIGFTRIGSRIKDLGPCFGMNGHPRRDMNVILRLSKSTIECISFYIRFTMELMVKMIVYDETMTFVRFFMKESKCFRFFF